MTFVLFNSRPLNTVHALYSWVPPRVRCLLAHVRRTVPTKVALTYRKRLTYLACTSLSARTWARPAARRRLCDLPKVRRAREEVIKEVTSRSRHTASKNTAHPDCCTFSSFDFHDRALRGRAVLGRSRGRRRRRRLAVAPRAGLPLYVRRIH